MIFKGIFQMIDFPTLNHWAYACIYHKKNGNSTAVYLICNTFEFSTKIKNKKQSKYCTGRERLIRTRLIRSSTWFEVSS